MSGNGARYSALSSRRAFSGARWATSSLSDRLALALALALASARASAAGPTDLEAAHEAYDQGRRAHERGDDAEAAADFMRADALHPNATALRFGLLAATLADRPEIAMTLVERAEKRGRLTPELSQAVDAARARFAPRVGRVLVRCDAARCAATLDGLPVAVGVPTFVITGDHVVEIDAAGKTDRQPVHVDQGAFVTVSPPAARVTAPPAAVAVATKKPLSRTWFFVGLGGTAVVGGLTIASGVDTKNKHDAFEAAGIDIEGGRAAQTRTNILLVATGTVGLATAAIGLFAVRWGTGAPKAGASDPPATRWALAATPEGATIRGLF